MYDIPPLPCPPPRLRPYPDLYVCVSQVQDSSSFVRDDVLRSVMPASVCLAEPP